MDRGLRLERLTGARLDRLTHHVNILELNGESYRLSQEPLPNGQSRHLTHAIRSALTRRSASTHASYLASAHAEALTAEWPGSTPPIGRLLLRR